jgi:RimJ/RimL family protein N-acetyltransferase
MIKGKRLILRPIKDEDWQVLEAWGEDREALWGPYQRFQLDHLPVLRQAYQQTGLLTRDSGFFLVEAIDSRQVVGFVRYTLMPFPDADLPYPEVGFGIPDAGARGHGYAKEAVALLVGYLFAGYPIERLAAFTDVENLPARRLLEALGFQCEGILRRSTFRDGHWCDLALYALLREEWKPKISLEITDG